MQTFISAIEAQLSPTARLLYDYAKLVSVVKAHQCQYPGNWQNWEHTRMAPYMAAGFNLAAQKNETATARILQEGF